VRGVSGLRGEVAVVVGGGRDDVPQHQRSRNDEVGDPWGNETQASARARHGTVGQQEQGGRDQQRREDGGDQRDLERP
jgi:hypothetical protein